MTILAGALALLLSSGATAEVPSPRAAADHAVTRTFRDWYVVCDNGLDCYAYGPGTQESGFVRVAMAAGPEAEPVVALAFPWESDPAPDIAVRIDGARYVARARDADHSPPEIAQGRAAIAAMATGRAMTQTAEGKTLEISLSGAAAALLWIDEMQGRVGTVTALVRRGAAPAASVPPVPVLQRVVAAPAIDQAGWIDGEEVAVPPELLRAAKVADCTSRFGDSQIKGDRLGRLDDHRILWEVVCYPGAYQTGMLLFITDPQGAHATPVRLPVGMPREPGDGQPSSIEPSYDPTTRTLFSYGKGRGLGDCGVISSWVWTGQAFALAQEESMENCWGSRDLWPTTYRSR